MNFFENDSEVLFQKLAAYYFNELTPDEKEQVYQWIHHNEENAQKYKAVQQLLQQDDAAREELDIDVDKGWAELNAKIAVQEEKKKGKVRHMGWYWAAAAVMAGLLIGGWLFFQSPAGSDGEWIAKTGFDTLQLADGTTIIANGKATVKYHKNFNQGNRDIQLEGNAFFHVHRDTTQPFSIVFNEGKVTVLGTQFFINQQTEGFEVKVTEGKVKAELLHQQGEAILTRGKMVTYNKATNQFAQQDFAEAAMLKYNNEPVQTIVKDLFLAKGIRVRTSDEIAATQLTVDFTQSSTEEILKALELLSGGQLQKTGANEYQLTK